MKKVLVVNGPNLNLLGQRETDIYGSVTLNEIENRLRDQAAAAGLAITFFQSNHEGELIDCLHAHRGQIDCVLINAGGLTHTSVALHDALRAMECPVIEVHMSNIYRREPFRHQSLVAPAAVGGIFGFGPDSYTLALEAAAKLLSGRTL